MLGFLTQIVDFFKLLVSVIVNLFESLIFLILEIPRWLTWTISMTVYLPSQVIAFLIFGVLVSVLLLIVGRNT